MPTPRPGSDRLRLELDILASELDGGTVPATPTQSSDAPPEAPNDDGDDTSDPALADGDRSTHAC